MNKPACTKCGLHLHAKNIRIPCRGAPSPIISFVGDGPGKTDDETGSTFGGPNGEKLEELMRKAGLDSQICSWHNIVKCVPWQEQGWKVRAPEEEEVDACCSYLEAELDSRSPVLIVPMGAAATQYFLPKCKITKVRGRRHFVTLPTLRYRYQRMRKMMKIRGHEDKKLFGKTPLAKEKALDYAIAEHGYIDPPQREATVFPTMSIASTFYGPPTAELDILADLNYLASWMNQESEDLDSKYRLITTLDDTVSVINQLIGRYRAGDFKALSVDLETTSLDAFDLAEKICTVGVSPLGVRDEAWIFPFEHTESPYKGDMLALKVLKENLSRMFREIPVGGQNFKFDYMWMMLRDVFIKKIAFDTELAAWTLYNDTIPHDLEYLVSRFTDMPLHKQEMKQAQDALPKEEKYNMNNYPLDLVGRYNGADCDGTGRLDDVFQQDLINTGMLAPHNNLTIASIIPVAHMEMNGCIVNLPLLERLDKEMEAKVDEIYRRFEAWGVTKMMENLRGKTFKLSSPEAVQMLLFDVLEFTPKKFGKKQKGGKHEGERLPSASREVLDDLFEEANAQFQRTHEELWQLRLEVVKAIREFKDIHKEWTSYIRATPKHIRADGYLHAEYGIRKTKTGRFVAHKPPIQTIPWHSDTKRAYESRFEGGFLLEPDFSQQELRILCTEAGDKSLRDAFHQGLDIHTYVTARVMSAEQGRAVSMSEVPEARRRRNKTVLFGLLYGRGKKSIAAQEGISVDEAQEIIDSVFREFPAVFRFIKAKHAEVLKNHEIWSLMGFRRLIEVERGDESGRAKRQAVNTPIQGCASDITLAALIKAFWRAKKLGFSSKLWNFIHDSFGWDVPPSELYDLAVILQKEMVDRPPRIFSWLDVPLKAEFEIGVTWGEKVEMMLLEERQLRFKGSPEFLEKIIARFEAWPEAPTLILREEGMKQDKPWLSVVYRFPERSRDEPVYLVPGLTIAA